MINRRSAQVKTGPRFLEELFDSQFMKTYTEFDHFDDMVEASGIPIDTAKAQREIESSPEWNAFIKTHTLFSSWVNMKNTAIKQTKALNK
ncbi:hypothetical protein [Alteribacter populi]|uniref:hypothetical protein n=1 Tax=Alteribacter populi TaxID=2011011 RepID=UPI000BBA470D|nr:hypothetical protein [Alteribacter populi]